MSGLPYWAWVVEDREGGWMLSKSARSGQCFIDLGWESYVGV